MFPAYEVAAIPELLLHCFPRCTAVQKHERPALGDSQLTYTYPPSRMLPQLVPHFYEAIFPWGSWGSVDLVGSPLLGGTGTGSRVSSWTPDVVASPAAYSSLKFISDLNVSQSYY